MLYLDISILGHFHLHQNIYKILCMNCSAGKTVNIPLSAYMPFGWIVCPSVISSDSTVLKLQTLFFYSSTNLNGFQGFRYKIFRLERLSLKHVWDPVMGTWHIQPTQLSYSCCRDLSSDTGPGNSWGDLTVAVRMMMGAVRPAAWWRHLEEGEWGLQQNDLAVIR